MRLFWCAPDTTLDTLYTQKQQREKLAKLYPVTLSHLRLHELQVTGFN